MLTVARTYVKDRAVAEEVVQETWLGVINGLDRFEGRSSLKTWILSILVNQAKTRGTREARSVPFTSLALDDEAPAVEAERFRGPEDPFTGGWRSFPARWNAADAVLQDRETVRVAMRAIADLPLTQQTVIRMRDVEGYSAEEVCATLDVSEANQRVLLHRARSRVRSALERHLDG
jgi:RNA polymerase sigma-70 factor (ECF subfamily)